MLLLLLRHRRRRPQHLSLNLLSSPPRRSFIATRLPWVLDRALDHAVEKEKHLIPFLNVKDLLLFNSSPLPLPLALITLHSPSLSLPYPNTLRFLRRFPSSFFYQFPRNAPKFPHFRPSPPLLDLHDQELLIYSSCRQETADRLLRLLMLCPRRRLPIKLIYALRFDLGLPRDFPRSLLPYFPDYFRIVPSETSPRDLDLEVEIYHPNLAVSQIERAAMMKGGYKKGAPLAFPQQYTVGYTLRKTVGNWLDKLHNLPYVSPYEGGVRLPPRSDVWEKWAVGMLHELLSLMVARKTERRFLEMLAGHVGLPAKLRTMVLHYPGIFYLSNKLRTQTVVLKEGYWKHLLVEKHPLVGLRYHYMSLMRKDTLWYGHGKSKNKKKKRKGDEGLIKDEDGCEGLAQGENGGEGELVEQNEDISWSSDFESEDDDDDYDDDDDDDESDAEAENNNRVDQHGTMQGFQGIRVERVEPRRPIIDKHQATKTRRNQRVII